MLIFDRISLTTARQRGLASRISTIVSGQATHRLPLRLAQTRRRTALGGCARMLWVRVGVHREKIDVLLHAGREMKQRWK